MGTWINFTNITCFLFLIYLITTIKSFYDIFYPRDCKNQFEASNCLHSIPNWQNEFIVILLNYVYLFFTLIFFSLISKLSLCITTLKQKPKLKSQCDQYFVFPNLNESFSK